MISAIYSPTVLTMMKFMKKKVLKCLWVMKDMDIGLLIPTTLPIVITEVMNIGLLRPATLPLIIVDVFIVVMLVEVDLGNKIPVTVYLTILEQEFMLCRSQACHYSSHNPGKRGRLFTFPVSFCRVDENVYEKEKGDIIFDDDDGRRNIIRGDGVLREI